MIARPSARAPHPDLFGTPVLPGLAYRDDVVTPAEEADLIAHIEAADLTPFQFQQWEGKRLTRSFGWTYDFQSGRFAPGDPMPPWLDPLRARAAAFADLDATSLEQALLIEYGVGAGIGSSNMKLAFLSVRRQRCDSAAVRTASSNARPPTWRHGRFITSTAKPGTTGSTASLPWMLRDGR